VWRRSFNGERMLESESDLFRIRSVSFISSKAIRRSPSNGTKLHGSLQRRSNLFHTSLVGGSTPLMVFH